MTEKISFYVKIKILNYVKLKYVQKGRQEVNTPLKFFSAPWFCINEVCYGFWTPFYFFRLGNCCRSGQDRVINQPRENCIYPALFQWICCWVSFIRHFCIANWYHLFGKLAVRIWCYKKCLCPMTQLFAFWNPKGKKNLKYWRTFCIKVLIKSGMRS